MHHTPRDTPHEPTGGAADRDPDPAGRRRADTTPDRTPSQDDPSADQSSARLDAQGRANFRRLLGYLKPYRLVTAGALLALVVMAALDVLRPLLIGIVVDRVIGDGEVRLLVPLVVGIIGLSLGHGGATYALTYLRRQLGEWLVRDLRAQLYRHLHFLDTPFHDRSRTGDLISRTSTDVAAIRKFVGYGLVSLVRIVVTISFIVGFGLTLSPGLTVVILAVGPGLYLTVRSFRRQIKPAFQAIHEQNANVSAALSENITGVQIVRSFGQEEQEKLKFAVENDRSLERQLDAVRIRSRHAPLVHFWGLLSRGLLLAGGGWLVIIGRVSLGTFVAFDGYLARLMSPIREAPTLIDLMGEALAAADRIFALLDTSPTIANAADAAVPATTGGQVRFDAVSLNYDGVPTLRDIDLTLRPRETVAVIGTTGAGKTSLVQLINRAYDPDRGRVTLDGQDLRHYPLQTLRRRIAVIPQDSFLFSTTIAENIAYGRPEATQAEIEDAARRAQAHDFITRLPHGYRTIAGERGTGLSGGQKQRITIARALVAQPSVLVIDDATSAVDTETEYLIWHALEEVIASATTVIVAQRLSTLRQVDRIVVLDRGRVAEVGPPAELLERDGHYARMYRLQTDAAAAEKMLRDRQTTPLAPVNGKRHAHEERPHGAYPSRA